MFLFALTEDFIKLYIITVGKVGDMHTNSPHLYQVQLQRPKKASWASGLLIKALVLNPSSKHEREVLI